MKIHQSSRCSPEALAFLSESLAEPPRDVTTDNLPALRAEVAAEFAPRVERALARFAVEVRPKTLAGIACLDVVPDRDRQPGTVLYCYGGGFIMGSPQEDLIVMAALAARAGVRIVAPWYRLAPEHPHPAAIDDCMTVLEAVAEDPACGPLALAGESAGGNAALSLLRRLAHDGTVMPAAVALLSPWSDLTHRGPSHRTNDGRDPTLSLDLVCQAADLYAGGRDLADPDISPLRGTWTGPLPPVTITTGTRDLFLSQNEELARILDEAGADVTLSVRDELWHVFEFYDEIPEAHHSLRDIADFLRSHLDGAAKASEKGSMAFH